jgi:hypothetical protein
MAAWPLLDADTVPGRKILQSYDTQSAGEW